MTVDAVEWVTSVTSDYYFITVDSWSTSWRSSEHIQNENKWSCIVLSNTNNRGLPPTLSSLCTEPATPYHKSQFSSFCSYGKKEFGQEQKAIEGHKNRERMEERVSPDKKQAKSWNTFTYGKTSTHTEYPIFIMIRKENYRLHLEYFSCNRKNT